MIKYVVVRLTNDKQANSFHIYSKTSGNKDTMVNYMESLKSKYSADTQWKVMTEEQAMKRIERKSLADRGWITENLMSHA